MRAYDPKEIEPKWQKRWIDDKVFAAHDDSKKEKRYQLETFPYPSAAGLHMGHPKGYAAEDIQARFARMGGGARNGEAAANRKEVLYTMGWDAFGLPTENFAIKVGRNPQDVTNENTENFRRQVRMFGFSYDWDREVNTSKPDYYKWTQWLFLQLFKKGLAYQAAGKVNWCPKDQTVLANEQVVDGHCERCGSVIEERDMTQWFLRITAYADRLLDDLKKLDWPAATLKRQEDWIGRSEGALISFATQGNGGAAKGPIEVFTTRPETIFGATYMVLAPEHPFVASCLADGSLTNAADVAAYVAAAAHKTELMRKEDEKEKTGVELKGVSAVNPATNQPIPVWIADYVLGSYGTGAIMAVPAHDGRDAAFAAKFRLPVVEVIEPETGQAMPNEERRSSIVAIVEDREAGRFLTLDWGPKLGGTLFIGGGRKDGEDEIATALREIKEETGYGQLEFVGRTGRMHHHYFAFSKNVARNIDVVGLHFVLKGREQEGRSLEADEQGRFSIEWLTKEDVLRKMEDENHLLCFRRLVLGEIYAGRGILAGSAAFTGRDSEAAKWDIVQAVRGTRKTQYRIRDWSVSRQRYWGVPIPIIHCERDGAVPVPESDLPVVLPPIDDYRPKGMPPLASSPAFINVKCPVCGGDAKRDAETLDTFVDSSWYFLRYADPRNERRIFDPDKAAHWLPVDLYVIGAEHTVLHLLYSRFVTKFLHDEGLVPFDEPFSVLRHQGLILAADGRKMSKSLGNVVNPDEIVGEFGADTTRLYLMFMGPFEDSTPWDPKGILGVERFLKRFWNYVVTMIGLLSHEPHDQAATEGPKRPVIHKTIKKVGEDIVSFKFNTAISALMIMLNELTEMVTTDDGEDDRIAMTDRKDLEAIVKLVHPFAPHMGQELWSMLGHADGSYLDFEPWPAYDEALVVDRTVKLVLQVNGKVRDTVEADASVTEEQAKDLALRNPNVARAMAGAAPKRVIYVDKKIVNIVI